MQLQTLWSFILVKSYEIFIKWKNLKVRINVISKNGFTIQSYYFQQVIHSYLFIILNSMEYGALRDLKFTAQNIDKLVGWALEKQEKKICDKYSNISNTVKILRNLMTQFSKKADRIEKFLVETCRIDEIQYQKNYYEKRIEECMNLSQKIRKQIEQRSEKISIKQKEVKQLKKKLMLLKTDNIKIMMKMETIQQNYLQIQQKESVFLAKQERKRKVDMQRKLFSTSQICFQGANTIINELDRTNMQYETLLAQSRKLDLELFKRIDKAKQLRLFVQDCFTAYRTKLVKQERKSNNYGLAGSMLFRLESKEGKGEKTKMKKKLSDPKLLVYDILKQKYEKSIRQQRMRNEEINISEQQFLKFKPMQILGVIELKGGLKNIINKIWIEEKKEDQGKNNIVKYSEQMQETKMVMPIQNQSY